VAAHRELVEWVSDHEDGFWITAAWFRYQTDLRRGMLGHWLRALVRVTEAS
jgi:hypothetical protein